MEQLRSERWVISHNGDRGILAGNPHTHPGRFLVLWESLGASYSTSLSDIADMSAESRAWLDGYLSGCEPDVFQVLGLDDDAEPTEEQYGAWRAKLIEFHESGSVRLPLREHGDNDRFTTPRNGPVTPRSVFILNGDQPAYVIVFAETGVFYRHQFAGLVCHSNTVQGYLVPVIADQALRDLDELFVRGGGHDQCGVVGQGEWTDEMQQRVITAVETVNFYPSDAPRQDYEKLRVDLRRIDEMGEGWVPVITPDGDGVFIW